MVFMIYLVSETTDMLMDSVRLMIVGIVFHQTMRPIGLSLWSIATRNGVQGHHSIDLVVGLSDRLVVITF